MTFNCTTNELPYLNTRIQFECAELSDKATLTSVELNICFKIYTLYLKIHCKGKVFLLLAMNDHGGCGCESPHIRSPGTRKR